MVDFLKIKTMFTQALAMDIDFFFHFYIMYSCRNNYISARQKVFWGYCYLILNLRYCSF